jgi:hypothetical protein
MTLAHEPHCAPRIEQQRPAFERSQRRGVKYVAPVGAEDGGGRRQLAVIPINHPPHAAGTAVIPPRARMVVERGHRVRDTARQIEIELAALRHPIQQPVLIEAPHLDEPFDRLSAASEG